MFVHYNQREEVHDIASFVCLRRFQHFLATFSDQDYLILQFKFYIARFCAFWLFFRFSARFESFGFNTAFFEPFVSYCCTFRVCFGFYRTFCFVERSFSIYKNILTDRRYNFTEENLEMYIILNFNKAFDNYVL